MNVSYVQTVTINSNTEATIPTRTGTDTCNTLVDTGASRSCMSESHYNKIKMKTKLPPIQELIRTEVRSASGSDLQALGVTRCPFQLGGKSYEYDFIICRNLKRPMILGIDFLRNNRIGTDWSDKGHFVLRQSKNILVESIETVEKGMQIKVSHDITVPGRTVIVLDMEINARDHESPIYDVKPNTLFQDEHPNLVTIPTLHKVQEGIQRKIPHVMVNLEEQSVFLEKGTIVGFLEPSQVTVDQITTETAHANDINIQVTEAINAKVEQGVDINEVKIEEILSEGGFITSPADINVHRRVELKDAEVTEDHKIQFKKICKEYEDIFSKDSADIGRTPLIQMEIDTGDSPPVSQKPYNLPLKHVEWVQREIETLEKAGVIVRSVSPWASPIVIVPKKSEPGEPPKRRLCVDYRSINSLLPKVDKAHSKAKGILSLVPLPKIDEIYAKLKGSKIYSTFDMRSGYYHIALTEESQPKSAFVVGGPKGGKYEFKVVPFGLAQAPAYFQQLVNQVLEGLDFAFGYLDDILVFSSDVDSHLEHIKILYQKLREANLKLKESKCNFLKKHVQYLGHIISGEGLEPVPEKLEAIEKMPPPTTPKEVKQFLGLIGYYRKFIPRFADIARCLTTLTKLDQLWEWTEQCQKSFELLKQTLMEHPILKYPDPNRPYIMYTDASKYAWACVLTQEYEHNIEGKVRKVHHHITSQSGLMHGSQLNWAALTKEAYAIYMSVKKLVYYLEDAQTILRSDHMPLRRFLHKKTLNTKVNNWAIELSPFQIQFEYIKGIKNTLADTMSRLIEITPEAALEPEPEGYEFGYFVFDDLDPIRVETIEHTMDTTTDPIPSEPEINLEMSKKQVIQLQMVDPFCNSIMDRLLARTLPEGDPYYLSEGVLHKYVTDNKQRFETVVAPQSLIKHLLEMAHDHLGHNGSTRTYAILKRLYYWKGMKNMVKRYVKQCQQCRLHNVTAARYAKHHFEVPSAPMDFICMDLIGEFHPPSAKNNRFALTAICMLTGYTWCIPIKNKFQETVVQAYLDHIYAQFGGSRKILSDNGSEFKNELFTKVAQELGVQFKAYTAPWHPQSNGRIEGFHRFLKACMAKHISKDLEWDDLTPLACAAYNFLPNEHSKESPFFLMFGRDPRLPLTEMFQPKVRYLGDQEGVLSVEALKRMYQLVAHNIQLARERLRPETPAYPTSLKPNDMVMIKTHADKAFEPKYKGPFRIVSLKGNQVEVAPGTGGASHFVHIADVKYILPADYIVQQIPDYAKFGRQTKLNFDPNKAADLQWQFPTTLYTPPTTTVTYTTTPTTIK